MTPLYPPRFTTSQLVSSLESHSSAAGLSVCGAVFLSVRHVETPGLVSVRLKPFSAHNWLKKGRKLFFLLAFAAVAHKHFLHHNLEKTPRQCQDEQRQDLSPVSDVLMTSHRCFTRLKKILPERRTNFYSNTRQTDH